MSMFGDEARFSGKMMVHEDGVASFYRVLDHMNLRFLFKNLISFYFPCSICPQDCTDPKIGPGQYYDARMETARSWNKKGPKISEDVSSKKGLDRSHHYRAGVLLDSGLMLSGNRASNISDPGPGYYDPVSKTDIAYTTNKEHARETNNN